MDADEVLIELAYTGVNPVDWKIREGYLKDALPHELPIIPGWDAAGDIADVGEAVLADLKFGDKVYAYCRKPVVHDGTYAEAIAVPASYVAKVPSNLTLAQAAAVPLAGLTAWQALFDRAGLTGGHKLLVHAGAGGVGSFGVQFGKWAGATVYTTASAPNHDYVRALGADVAIDYRDEDFAERIARAEPQGLDVVFDLVGGDVLRRSYELLKPGGALVSIVDFPNEDLARRGGLKACFHFVEPSGDQLQEIGDLIEAGEITSPEIEVMPLEEAAQAQQRSQAGHVRGKLVLKIK